MTIRVWLKRTIGASGWGEAPADAKVGDEVDGMVVCDRRDRRGAPPVLVLVPRAQGEW
jgi:hypothetical protein